MLRYSLVQAIQSESPLFPTNFQRALEQFDVNNDGLIDYGEFKMIHRKYPMVLYPGACRTTAGNERRPFKALCSALLVLKCPSSASQMYMMPWSHVRPLLWTMIIRRRVRQTRPSKSDAHSSHFAWCRLRRLDLAFELHDRLQKHCLGELFWRRKMVQLQEEERLRAFQEAHEGALPELSTLRQLQLAWWRCCGQASFIPRTTPWIPPQRTEETGASAARQARSGGESKRAHGRSGGRAPAKGPRRRSKISPTPAMEVEELD